ncbi:MAG: heterodisulfide reductase [Desulfobulbus sp.]|nr:heterodisulfide reductase [Desulfobulbus sp.]
MLITQEKINEAVSTIIEYGGRGILNCVQCGACSAICPGVRAGFPLLCRSLIRHLLNGELEEIIEDSSSWACQACCRCTEVCPRGVRPQEVVFAFRRYQGNQLAFSTSSVTSQMNLFETGHAVYVDPKEARSKVGLPEKTPTSAFDEQAKQEIQTLINNSPMGQLGLF